jgi:hypothetical protein
MVLPITHQDQGCIPADLKPDPRWQSRGGLDQTHTLFGVFGEGKRWKRIFASRSRAPTVASWAPEEMLKTVDKDQGTNAVEPSVPWSFTTLS